MLQTTINTCEAVKQFLKEVDALNGHAALVWSYLSKDQRQQIPSLDLEAEPFIVESMAATLKYQGVHQHLKDAMTDCDFSRLKEHLGILLLCHLNSLAIPAQFDSKSAANKWLLDKTQEKFKRKGERWDSQSIEKVLRENRELIFEAANFLGMTDPIYPELKKDEQVQAFIPGALKMRVDLRLGFLMKYCSNSTYPLPKAVFLVTGDRELKPDEEPEIKAQGQRTEKWMMERAMQKISKGEPVGAVPCHVVNGKKDLALGLNRATTQTSAQALSLHSALSSTSKRILFIEQPYSRRFKKTFQNAIGGDIQLWSKGFDFENSSLFIIQDECASMIYDAQARLKLS